jgi:putative FmdB family regulatory protein
MPIMVYICKNCGTKVEYLRFKRQKADKNPYCHECNKKMTKVMYPANLRFEGGGWQTPKPEEN